MPIISFGFYYLLGWFISNEPNLFIWTTLGKIVYLILSGLMAFRFLNEFTSLHLIADWPEDIAHFCAAIITGPGEMMNIPSFTCEVRRDLSTKNSKILHNALSDARAIYEADIESKLL